MTSAFDVIGKVASITAFSNDIFLLLLEYDLIWYQKGKFRYYGWLHVRWWWLRRLWGNRRLDDNFDFNFMVEQGERKLQVIGIHAVEIMTWDVVLHKKYAGNFIISMKRVFLNFRASLRHANLLKLLHCKLN